jgi:D-lactate dehydrogenase (cytochrome)
MTLLRARFGPRQLSRLSRPSSGRVTRARGLASGTDSTSSAAASSVPFGYIALASALSGLAGYWLASRPKALLDTKLTPVPHIDAAAPQYGSPEDFKQAIKELKACLPGDAVSTDPDVLYEHGYSENDYHPGEQPIRARRYKQQQ